MTAVSCAGVGMTDRLDLLLAENVDLLHQGVDIITSLPEGVYANNTHELFRSGVGKHFRHILDFYDRFLARRSDVIDYDARNRDTRIESDARHAAGIANAHAASLQEIAAGSAEHGAPGSATAVTISSEVQDQSMTGVPVQSSIGRELSVLASHTVHHYAIIALLLRIQGVEVDHSFGVAPSTLRYLAAQK